MRDRSLLVLLDLLGVTVAGSRTAERRAHVQACAPGPGPALILGSGVRASGDTAVVLNGAAACCLELDEGNRYARGHPAAHAAFAALAEAERRQRSGAAFLAAFVAGYEVGARVGAATRLRPGVHPHGTWGAIGAAVAAAMLGDADRGDLPGTMDAAATMSLAPPFSVALDGRPVRDLWTGMAGLAGLHASRLADAGLAPAGDSLQRVFGDLLGELDPGPLEVGPGDPWMISRGYFKRHASCAYTHPPADVVLALRDRLPSDPSAIEHVTVETHRLATPLDRVEVPTRLAAMFSIPWVVATALVHGEVTPERMAAQARADRTVGQLATRVRVELAEDIDAALPDRRGARVTVRLADGIEQTAGVDLPVGDADHHPLGRPEVQDKLAGLLGPDGADRVAAAVDGLPDVDDITSATDQLPA